MTHAISATFTRYDRMSPTAAALAVLLHVVTALALWWVSPLNQQNFEQDPIDVTIEQPQPPLQPKPEPPPSAPQAKPSPPPASATSKPAPATPLGLTPPAPTTAETPKQATPKGDTRDAPPALPKAEAPPPQEPPPEPQQQAVAPPPPAPARPIELPPVEAPPPPATSQDFFRPPPPAAPPPTPKPETRAAPPLPPRQQLRPSPLREPPQRLPGDPQGSAPSSPFVNPANEAAVTHAHEDYITQVARQLSQYRFHPKDSVAYTRRGVISVFMVVARDGRLLNASIAQSSGAPTFDVEMLGFIRGIAPFPPLPSDLPGDQTSFTLRIPYNLNPG